MSRVVVLDTGVLGLLVHPHPSLESAACRRWLETLLPAGDIVALPEIADYELRREILRRRATASLRRLETLHDRLRYIPLTTAAMRQAAAFWAQARQRGTQTAADAHLDADVILAAQTILLASVGNPVIIATTNVKHLTLYTPAQLWQDI